MNGVLVAAIILTGVVFTGSGILFVVVALLLALLALCAIFWRRGFLHLQPVALHRIAQNPILEPNPALWWESEAVFNPAAFYEGGRVHLLYRALGGDGISRIGYASSRDGIHFDERLPYPVYTPMRGYGIPNAKRVYGPLSYNTAQYASGGGWGGAEDPRVVRMDDRIYLTHTLFDGWGFVRMALTSISAEDFDKKQWNWTIPQFLSPPGEVQKNWVLFPEKVHSKYAILHSLSPDIQIAYVDNLDEFDGRKFIEGSTRSGGRKGHWDAVVRGAGAPPLKTPKGWLLLYHGFDPAHPDIGYKVGAMLLDLNDPTKILYRSNQPILEAQEWYENDWKPGVTYASGAVVVGDDLFVYYGGGDKRIAAAKANLNDFLQKLARHEHAALTPVKV